jgi:hypothetical protein
VRKLYRPGTLVTAWRDNVCRKLTVGACRIDEGAGAVVEYEQFMVDKAGIPELNEQVDRLHAFGPDTADFVCPRREH